MMPALHAVLGLAVLLGAGALLASALYFLGLWRDTVRPPRRTAAWSLVHRTPAHPEDCGYSAVERAFARADGGTTPCWLVTGRAPHSGAVVIILHGHGRSRWDSLRRAAPWVERSALVALPDLRGHGDASGRTTLGQHEPADILLMMGELAALHPGARFTLVGHSMGAVIAIHVAARVASSPAHHGLVIDRVEALGPYDSVRTPLRARVRARGLPGEPFPWLVRTLQQQLDGPEIRTQDSAAKLGMPLAVHADINDHVSPATEARIIAAAAPHGTLSLTRGTLHGDLGVPASPASEPPATAATPSPAPAPPHPA